MLCQLHWVIELKHPRSGGVARRSDWVNVAWVVLHCNAALELGTETAGTTCALSSSISGAGKSNQASHVRASSVPTLYAPLAVDFAILGSHFWYRPTVPKMGP